MKLRLVRLDDVVTTNSFDVDRLPIVIGSSDDARVRVRDAAVSSFHCSIAKQSGRLIVRDLGSAHGTFLNGYRVRESLLRDGDRVRVGGALFRTEFDSVATAPI